MLILCDIYNEPLLKPSKLFTNTFIASALIVLMCVQYVPLEGVTVSSIKFAVLLLMPVIFLLRSPKLSKAFYFGMAYFAMVLCSALYNIDSFRLGAVGYIFAYVFMFITYYNLVYKEHAFTIEQFVHLLKGIIYAYTIVLLIQQFFKIIGIAPFDLINMHYCDERGILTANALSIEQSHSARILVVLYLALLRMYELQWGKGNVTIKTLFQRSKWVSIAWLWSMITMGSGTAIVALAILALYFVRRRYAIYALPLVVLFYFAIPYIPYLPLQRAKNTFEAALTLDEEKISKADLNASARVLPYVYTLNHFDLSKRETWIGHGVDTGKNNDIWDRKRMVGGMTDYGFVAYLLALLFVYAVCIRRICSLESLIFVVLLMAELRSVYLWWGIMMLFTTIRYFQMNNHLCDDKN